MAPEGSKAPRKRPRVGQKKPPYDFLRPPRLGCTICYGQTWVRKSYQNSAVRFVTAKRGSERATKTRQYDVLRPNVGQKEPPRLGSTICYGQEMSRKSYRDSAIRFATNKSWSDFLAHVWPTTKTRQYDLLRPRVVPKEPPRLGSMICYGQELARKSHQDSAVRFVTPNVGQQEPPRLGSPICYGQELARISHQDSAVRFVTAKSWPEGATKTRQYDLLRPPPRLGSTICYGQEFGQNEPPRLGSTICYGQELARKSHQDSAARFVRAKRGPERAINTRQSDLLRPRIGQKEPPRLGNTNCYGVSARKSHQDSAVRFVVAKRGPETARLYDLLRPNLSQKEPPRLGSTICYGQELARKSHQDSAVRFVTAKSWPERATKTRHYDLLRPRVGQKEPPRPGSTICYGQTWARKKPRTICYGQKLARKPSRLGRTICYGQELARKEPPRLGSTNCYGQTWARKSQQDSAVRFVTAKSWPERATETRQYDLLCPNVAKRATKIQQYDLLRPNMGQKEPPRLGSTICYGQTWARKSYRDSAVRLVTAKRGPERATKTRQYDLLRPNVGQKEPPRLVSTIC